MPNPHQTKTYLRQRFQEMGIAPATRHGQNFLIDPNLQRVIVDTAEVEPQDVVLEVGTGTGALTALLAKQAHAVVSVEIDKHLHELASEELLDDDNVTLLLCDALKNKNQLQDVVLDAIRQQMATTDGRFLLVANLPYNIATPILSNLLLADPCPHSMTATVQKEVGDRFVAAPWTKDYGALSVWVQSQTTARIMRVLPPDVFWPRPKVDSAIVRLDTDFARRAQIPDLKYFQQFVKALFLHRRKLLRANVVAALKKHMTKEQIDPLLETMEFGPETRTEQLDVETLLRFTNLVHGHAPDWKL